MAPPKHKKPAPRAGDAGGGCDKPAPRAPDDPRFARIATDPRFARFPKAKGRVEVDDRFKGESWLRVGRGGGRGGGGGGTRERQPRHAPCRRA